MLHTGYSIIISAFERSEAARAKSLNATRFEIVKFWSRHDMTLSCLVFSVKTIEKITSLEKPLPTKSKQYLYNIFHIHSSQFLILMAQKSEEIMPDPDAIIRLRRDRLLCANLTGCDVNFCWMIQTQKSTRLYGVFFPAPGLKTLFCCWIFCFLDQ